MSGFICLVSKTIFVEGLQTKVVALPAQVMDDTFAKQHDVTASANISVTNKTLFQYLFKSHNIYRNKE